VSGLGGWNGGGSRGGAGTGAAHQVRAEGPQPRDERGVAQQREALPRVQREPPLAAVLAADPAWPEAPVLHVLELHHDGLRAERIRRD
jgi:hypothetical protein